MTTSASPWRYALIIFAVGQVVSPGLVFSLGSDALTSTSTETLITPPGWTFLVWGLICLLSLGYAFYQRPRPRPAQLSADLDRLARPLTVVFVLYGLWLAVAEVDAVWITVIISAAMLFVLLRAASIARRSDQLSRTRGSRILVGWPLGTYTGWTSVAVFVNLSAAVRQSGAPVTSEAGLAWQGVLLLAAVAVAAVVTYRWRAPVPYVLMVIWALAGAATSTYQGDALLLSIECGVGIAIVLLAAYLSRRHGAKPEGDPVSGSAVAT